MRNYTYLIPLSWLVVLALTIVTTFGVEHTVASAQTALEALRALI